MIIFDENNIERAENEIDFEKGYLIDDVITTEHPAVEAVEELWHYETVAEYPNGGKEVRKVVDVPGVAAAAAWTEREDILRYVLFTTEELAAREQERLQPTQLDRVEAQVMYTALMTDTLLEDE